MTKIVIVGAGGHAKVVFDILKTNPDYKIVGFISRENEDSVLGCKVLGDDSLLPQLYEEGVQAGIVAIGNNNVRQKLFAKLQSLNFQIVNAISPYAVISKYVKLGTGVAIMPGAIVNADTSIGDNVIVNTGATIDHDCKIGDHCHIAPGNHICGTVQIGNGVFSGAGTTIIDGINIGEGSILGAGSVITKNVQDYSLIVGVPGRQIKKLI